MDPSEARKFLLRLFDENDIRIAGDNPLSCDNWSYLSIDFHTMRLAVRPQQETWRKISDPRSVFLNITACRAAGSSSVCVFQLYFPERRDFYVISRDKIVDVNWWEARFPMAVRLT